ncbi:hypothetical protein MNBD_DELTA01-1917 [hydrothermal vent metagenome]|uniref:Molybdopterin oxidoreductase n=1 Tax=hydrothermal vent metagenome TaxID=652676 RepID=A0A3B0QRA9_9ZZZZ
MRYGILIGLIVLGVITFVATVLTTGEPRVHWAMVSVNLIFFLGITQGGIIFSIMFRVSKSRWGRNYMRLGEIITLSFIPVAIILFLAVGIGGVDHLFYWAHPEAAGSGHGGAHAMSPWLNKTFFYWRIVVTNILFYVVAYIYFRLGRAEERAMKASHDHLGADLPGVKRGLEKAVNVFAALTGITFVLLNTNLAWDFGMMIWKHWESTIFSPFYWVGNAFAGGAFLFLMSFFFLKRKPGVDVSGASKEGISKTMLSFALLWIYMFWSQYIVMWYTNVPHRMEPVIRQMNGEYRPIFIFMMLTLFVLPFLALIFRRMMTSTSALGVVAALVCTGLWVNRYLMVNSAFGETPLLGGGIGVMTTLAIGSATILSIALFRKVFPGITLKTYIPPSTGH